MVGLGCVTMMVAIDQTVVSTALPTVVAELRGFQLYAWVTTAYLLTSIITIPIFGRLGDYYGRKPFVVLSIVLFLVASVLCGIAQSMTHLVLGRALQGIAGGMMLGTAFAVVPDLFPDPHVRLRWQVILSSCFGVANAFGPSIGGFLTYYVGWRAVFFMNVPFGLVGLYFIYRYVPLVRQMQQTGIRLDWQGAVLIALALTGLQFLVQLLPVHGAHLSMVGLGLFTIACMTAFVWWEKRCTAALIPMEMFRDRSIVIMCVLSVFLGFIMFGLLIYIPLLLQGGFGLTAREVGVLITPLVVSITAGSIASARIVPRMKRPEFILHTGFGALVLCISGLLLVDAGTPRAVLVACLLGCGFGLGLLMPNLTIFVQELAGRSLLGISTAVLQSTRMIGGMLGTAVVGSIVSHYYVERVRQLDVTPFGNGAWLSRLEDPQVLVNTQVQSEFIGALQRLGLHGETFILHARESMVWGVHAGLVMAVVMAVAGLLWLRRMPPFKFGSRPVPPVKEAPATAAEAVSSPKDPA
ncbi:MFS transporter [Alcaligenaceae bacterium]|nr:MFS transporter [Alcaligenaceae bacterium]